MTIEDGIIVGPSLLTLGEVAALFYVRRETVWSWRRHKGFPAGRRIGGETRFERSAVQSWYQATLPAHSPVQGS